jgi:nucleotide-binding universal stress UspA family protein
MTRILVGIDGSEGSKQALEWACREAARDESAEITAVAAWLSSIPGASPWFVGYDIPTDLTEWTESMLKATVDAVVHERYPRVKIAQRVVCGSAGATLIAESVNADLVVVGSRGMGGFKGLLLGSVSHQVLTHAPCPAVVVPTAWRHADAVMNVIVVGADGSQNSTAALRWAATRAQRTGEHIHAVHAWQNTPIAYATIGTGVSFEDQYNDDARKVLEVHIQEASLPADVTVIPVVRHGAPAQMLIESAHHADLLVVGARGNEGFTGLLLGSVTNTVAHHTPCPMAVIRAN